MIAVQALLLAVLELLLDGFRTDDLLSIVVGGVVILGTVGISWPLVYRVASRLHPLLFPALSFLLTGAVILFVVRVIDRLDPVGIEVRDVQTAILIWVSLGFGSTMLGAFFSLNDDVAYDRFVTGPLRRRYLRGEPVGEPGFVFIEIDGLSEPALRTAMAHGYVPTMSRWLETGSHRLTAWETDLSSQTSASQAGILLGSNRDVPAFRWWDKQLDTLMVASRRRTAAHLERELSTGQGLLADGGASRWNIFSGDAVDCLGTYSRIGTSGGEGQRSYYAYFSNPFTVSRTAGLFMADVVREVFQSARQRVRNVTPRVRRSPVFALIRAGTTVLLPEASRFMLTADMYRGLPSIYCTIFAYDEVAHRAGVERPDSLKVLRMIDRTLAHLERVAAETSRPYHIIVLSDHGQSQGATFRQRYGHSLGQLVDGLIADGYEISSPEALDEGLAGLSSALAEVTGREDLPSARLVRRALRRPLREAEEGAERDDSPAKVVVLASGNMGLISFTQIPERMTLEQITEHFPALVPGLCAHEGIGFVLVKSAEDGGVVIDSNGIYYVDKDLTVGENPLSPFGPHAARHVRRTNSFANAPDILVMSRYDPLLDEVAAFEEHVGSHGGLGGAQTQPFLLYPSSFTVDGNTPIVGAECLHRVLRSWMSRPAGNRDTNGTAQQSASSSFESTEGNRDR